MERTDEDEDDFRILTARLRLRRPALTDAAPLAAIANNATIAVNLARLPHPYGEADALRWVRRVRGALTGHRADGPTAAFVIDCPAEDTVVGVCGVGPTGRHDGHQIGYWIGQPYWGCGYATEAALALVDHAFARLDLPHLWCSCRVTNDASRRVIEKSGFQYHGSGMQEVQALGASVPVEHYCMDRAMWEQRCRVHALPENTERHSA